MAGRNFRPHIQIDLTSDCDDPSCYLRLILPFPSSNACSISRENRRKLKVLLAVSIIQLSFCASSITVDIVGCSTVSSLTGDIDVKITYGWGNICLVITLLVFLLR